MGPDQALEELRAGNVRFLRGEPRQPPVDVARLRELFEQGQRPIACVLGCSDSRVPVELILDQGCGDLFVIRVAGNVADTHEIGSIEFAVVNLEAPLILVLGHTGCGAVTAVVDGAELTGCLPALLEGVAPAVARARAANATADTATLIAAAVRENVWGAIEHVLRRSAAVRARVRAGSVRLVGGVYDLASGRVDWLGTHPAEGALCASPEGTR